MSRRTTLPNLRRGRRLLSTVDAFPDLKWDGVIAESLPEANAGKKRTVEVKVQILNPDSSPCS
jgi:hypothetical protein